MVFGHINTTSEAWSRQKTLILLITMLNRFLTVQTHAYVATENLTGALILQKNPKNLIFFHTPVLLYSLKKKTLSIKKTPHRITRCSCLHRTALLLVGRADGGRP
jgi:hypothetical protein